MQACWITLDGQRWLFDEQTWTLKDWFVIKAETGLDRVPFLEGILTENPTALQGLIWFLRWRNGDQVPRAGIDFAPAALDLEPLDEPEADADPPVGGAEQTSAPAETSTSTSSPGGADSDLVMSTT